MKLLPHLPVRYRDASGSLTADPSTAATAVYAGPGEDILLRLTRTPRGRWRFGGSDLQPVPPAAARKRWASPAVALADVAYLRGYTHTVEVRP